jgi:hypothetical protein
MNRTVNLTKRIQTAKGLRYYTVVFTGNGRVKADCVIVAGQEEWHPEGSYYLEWWEGPKRIRLSVGQNAADANARRLQKEAELNALNNGVAVIPVSPQNQNGKSLRVAAANYLEEIRLSKKPKTYVAYATALKYFIESCPKVYVQAGHRPQGSAQICCVSAR